MEIRGRRTDLQRRQKTYDSSVARARRTSSCARRSPFANSDAVLHQTLHSVHSAPLVCVEQQLHRSAAEPQQFARPEEEALAETPFQGNIQCDQCFVLRLRVIIIGATTPLQLHAVLTVLLSMQ